MKFGIFYEMQLPRPWGRDDERPSVGKGVAIDRLVKAG